MLTSALRSATRMALPRASVAASTRMATPMYLRSAPMFVRFNSNGLTKDSPVTQYSGSAPLVKYTEEHEWIALHDDNVAFIGITKYAADALGDATFIELPTAGTEVEKGDSIGSVESVKSASDIYSPVAGEIVEGNTVLESSAGLINADPMGEAWFAKIKVSEPSELDELLSLEDYQKFLKSH